MSTSLELINLEQLLEEDCKCESDHRNTNNTVCSGEVVALKTPSCLGRGLKICDNSRRWNIAVQGGQARCASCHRLASECWTIRPI